MKFTSLKKITLFISLFLSFLLISCENFLQGADVKEQLDRLVQEANAPRVEVFLNLM